MAGSTQEVVFVTGFPAFTARRMIRKLLHAEAKTRVVMLVREKFVSDAESFRLALGASRRKRLSLLMGDVTIMHLGLAGDEYRRLCEETSAVFHMAAISSISAPRDLLENLHVTGTRNVLEFARDCSHLERLIHFSTCQVSGNRRGVFLEDELEIGQRFRNAVEETRYEAERLVRAEAAHLPVTVLRPGLIVGDSKTGEIDRFEGPYSLMWLIVASPVKLRLPLPGRGNAPLHLVPIDFVIDAAHLLARHPQAIGRTFHLVDSCPLGARHVYDLVAERAQRRPPRETPFPSPLAKTLLRIPGLERMGRTPLYILESLDHYVYYNCRGTLDLLAGTSVTCPPFGTYVDALITYLRESHETKQRRFSEEVVDSLDV